MKQTICILGRQPALGVAELESLFGAESIEVLGQSAVLLNKDPATIPFARLGGSVKITELLHAFDTTNWREIEQYLVGAVPKHLNTLPGGKLTIGLSVYGLDVHIKKMLETGLKLKKIIKSTGRPVRLVPNKQPELNSAQVIHNKLTGPMGWELCFIGLGQRTYMAQTVDVQDIEAYAARDQARPMRDAQVGMLPPKLAQIIINLANPKQNATILDPFCGTGVVLQEALLGGFNVAGTDLESRMIDYSNENLAWLAQRSDFAGRLSLAVGDATKYTWDKPIDTIASETYLGRPFSSQPKPEVLQKVMQDVDTIHRKFLRNVASQTAPGLRIALGIPAWRVGASFHHLKVLDSLEEFGYNRISFKHVEDKDLIYHREGQIVGRELVTLIRK